VTSDSLSACDLLLYYVRYSMNRFFHYIGLLIVSERSDSPFVTLIEQFRQYKFNGAISVNYLCKDELRYSLVIQLKT
jgi:hypothetical protein